MRSARPASDCGLADTSFTDTEVSAASYCSKAVIQPAFSPSAWNSPSGTYASGLMPFVWAFGKKCSWDITTTCCMAVGPSRVRRVDAKATASRNLRSSWVVGFPSCSSLIACRRDATVSESASSARRSSRTVRTS